MPDTPSHAFQRLLGLRTPIVSAPMGGAAGGALAAAVSAAGGLGMIGLGSTGSRAQLSEQLALVPAGVRVGIGLVDWVLRADPALLDLAVAAKPALLSVSFGIDRGWVERVQASGTLTAVQVASVEEARAAHEAGVDVLVARGLEGGGHGRPLRRRDEVLEETLKVTDRPVLSAGAVATADDVHRLLEAGAAGVWVGTAFVAAREALTSPGARRAILAADGGDTILTSVFDVAAGYAWPSDIPERVISNSFTDRWHDARGTFDATRAGAQLRDAIARDDPDGLSVNAGLGVAQVTDESSAAEIVAALTSAHPPVASSARRADASDH